jgi:predicted acetyltransferase
MQLVRPTTEHLSGFVDALQRGWSPDNLRGAAAAQEALARIASDPGGFLALTHDPEALGPPVTLPDGTQRPRLPGLTRWMWDAEGFVGSIGLRWARGGAPLPPHVLGHIGYSVVPWKRRQGHATQALAQLLPLAREQGLGHVELTTDLDNEASQRVILANGGVLVEHFVKGPEYGGKPSLRYRIVL